MRKVLPYPLLTASLIVVWMLLNAFTLGHLLLGTVVAVGASRVMTALEPSKPRLRRWQLIPWLCAVVLLDIARSNIAVVAVILQGSRRARRAGFVSIPLDLRDRTGLAVLACIVTSTPGTAWVEYDSATGMLVIHVLDLVEEQEWVELIKNRYEATLQEIFE